MKKPTVVLGANNNPAKYAYKAVDFLQSINQPVYPVGIQNGEVLGLEILHDFKHLETRDIHTVTLYLNPGNQIHWYKPILNLKPKRVIFNPGTENPEFAEMLEEKGIEVEEVCTLVMVRTGQY
ncbi:MAG: CoA-binding protein [Bacteroidia bacterium]